MTPQEEELLREQIAGVVENTFEATIELVLVCSAVVLSNKYGLNKEQISLWMQETLEAVKQKGIL